MGESVHATLERRFGLLKDKSWLRSKVEVENPVRHRRIRYFSAAPGAGVAAQ
jgi:hypothetical protein